LVCWPATARGRLAVDQHLEARLAQRAEEVEVLDPEEQLGVGQDTGVHGTARHQGGTPAGHVDGYEPGLGRHHVDGVGAPADEAPAVGHDGAHRRVDRGQSLDPGDQVGQARGGQVEQADVVLAEVDPLAARVGGGRLEPGPEPAGRSRIDRKPHHAHGGLEVRVVEPALAVDDDHDVVRPQPLAPEQRPHDVTGQPGTSVRQHHGGHGAWWPGGRVWRGRVGTLVGTHGAVTRLG
jgi:hypothetical protein